MDTPKPVPDGPPADSPFLVPQVELIAETPNGYDLSLMRDLVEDGQLSPISVRTSLGGFEVVGDQTHLAAIRMLVRLNRLVYDNLRGLFRPAAKVFALVSCRICPRRTPTGPKDEGRPATAGRQKPKVTAGRTIPGPPAHPNLGPFVGRFPASDPAPCGASAGRRAPLRNNGVDRSWPKRIKKYDEFLF